MRKYSEVTKNKECLYRYRSVDDKSIQALIDDKLFFSTPAYFNDPYDNLIFADSKKIVSQIIGSINSGMDDYIEKCKKNGLAGASIADALWNNKTSREIMLNDRVDMIYAALDAIRTNLKKHTKIICFSEVMDSMLMWSHYASYHKGFILVYDKESIENARRYNKKCEEINRKTKLVSVKYVKKQTDMTEACLSYVRHNMFDNMGDIEQVDASFSPTDIRKIISEKAIEWSYEKEWRLVPRVPSIEIESDLCFIKCRPLAVIVGSQCQGEEREQLIRICKNKNIPIYGIYLSESSADFKLCLNDEGNLEIAHTEHIFVYK